MPDSKIPWNTRGDAPWIGAPDGDEAEDTECPCCGFDAEAGEVCTQCGWRVPDFGTDDCGAYDTTKERDDA